MSIALSNFLKKETMPSKNKENIIINGYDIFNHFLCFLVKNLSEKYLFNDITVITATITSIVCKSPIVENVIFALIIEILASQYKTQKATAIIE